MNLDACERVFDDVLSSTTEAEFCHKISALFGLYEILSVGVGRASIYWRARLIGDQIWPSLFDLDYPPSEKARVGRLNDAKSPSFYVAGSIQTALCEVECQEGQIVQVAGFRVLKDEVLSLIVVGEYANVQKSGYMHFSGTDPGRTIRKLINEKESKAHPLIYVDKFLASIINDPSARDSGYIFSRALGAFLHSRVEADGIVFPSVRDRGGFNLAVRPEPSDRVFHNVACVTVRVGKKRRFGIQEYEVISSAIGLDDELNFLWPSSYQAGQLHVYGLTKEEHEVPGGESGSREALHGMLSMYLPKNSPRK